MFSSIRIRLTIWYLGILALIIVTFALATYLLIDRNLNQSMNKNLAEMSDNIGIELRKEETDLAEEIRQIESDRKAEDDAAEAEKKDGQNEPIPTIEAAIKEEITDLHFSGFQFAVFDSGGKMIVSTAEDKQLENSLPALSGERAFSDNQGAQETFRIHQTSLTLDGKNFRLVVIHSLDEQTAFLENLKRIFYFAIPVALVLSGLGGYFLARRSLAPVVAMSRQAENIGSTNLNDRLPVKNESDELGHLARVFNDLLGRLENSFKQQQRFMADASHELRTPLTIIRTEAEVALSRNERKSGEYRESLGIVVDESRRLSNIVEDLFLLARADREQFEPQMAAVHLDQILAEAVRAVRTLAEKRNINIHFGELAEMPVTADESLLHRLFLNLLDNAIKYNVEGGTVSINAKALGESFRVTISDTGLGIARENQAKIFDRFFRADEARSSDDEHISGGAGLGLSIAAWIARIHNGKLALEKSDAEGSTFSLELPAIAKTRSA